MNYHDKHSIQKAIEEFCQFIPDKPRLVQDSFYYNSSNLWEEQVIPFINQVNFLWKSSSEEEKNLFREAYHSLLFRYVSGYHESLLLQVRHYLLSNRLYLFSKIESVKYRDGQYLAKFKNQREYRSYGGVINATNLGNRVESIENIADMIQNLDSSSLRVQKTNLFVTGAITDNVVGVSKAIYLIKRQAMVISNEIIKEKI